VECSWIEVGKEKRLDFGRVEPGLFGLGAGLRQEGSGPSQALLSGTFERGICDERAEAGSAVNEAVSFEFFVGAFDRDDADSGLGGELADGGQRGAWGELTVGERGVDAGDDLFVESARRGQGERGEK
jgi:hypothetical protein